MNKNPTLELNGISYQELFSSDGLSHLDQLFLNTLETQDPDLHQTLLSYRQGCPPKTALALSECLISCAKVVETFLANLFNIEEALSISQATTTSHDPIAIFKKYFVLKRAKKDLARAKSLPAFLELNAWLQHELKQSPIKSDDKELAIALLGTHYLNSIDTYKAQIEQLVAWCTQALGTAEGQRLTKGWSSFNIPNRLDYQQLVPVQKDPEDPLKRFVTTAPLRLRDGFKLTDARMDAREVQDEIHYCIYCHDHDGDFCSKGFPVKKGDPTQGFKKNPLDITLTGCPLEEKISEMHLLKKDGHTIGALAMVMVDNPMCPATGHRICNDCMKACIYQKQDPVNIPQIETRVLTDVLALPWGVEIYDLLSRWNPLRQYQWKMKPYNGLKVMIAGMGPAGFTLAHHLLLEGFAVVGFDGLKIEPLPADLLKNPIYRFDDLKESLDERLMAGFGGVAEYGITVRWDKNFLKLIYLSLLRRPYFQVFGGIRFGGTIQVNDAWEMGFDHFVVAVGAGLPKALSIPGSLNTGMRQANDFLMALQLGSAAKTSSLTNLQIRLPAVVIGGGLTGVDTATEIQAYYIRQVEKISLRYQTLAKTLGKEKVLAQLDLPSKLILDEFLAHAECIQKERERAKKEGGMPNFIKLIQAWGGVTIAYRRKMQASPAYIHNHEELQKALQEGVYYLEELEPLSVELDQYGHTKALICHDKSADAHEVRLPANTILVATGTQPNTAYEFEHRGTFNRLNLQYQHYEEEEGELVVAHGVTDCKDSAFGPFTSYQKDAHRVSLVGDTHPIFHGSVVKAIASGMRTYPKILKTLTAKLNQTGSPAEYRDFAQQMESLFQSHIVSIERKTKHVLEMTVQAPLAVKHFQPGQFYRLQNFETSAAFIAQTQLQMEPLALVAAHCDKKKGQLTFMVTEHSVAAKLCALLKPGEQVSLMGPTGIRSKIPTGHETVLIVGELASLPFLRIYGTMLREAGNHVLYFGQFNQAQDIYCLDEIKKAADFSYLQSAERSSLHPEVKHGQDIIDALIKYAEKPTTHFSLHDVDRIYVVGESNLLKRFQAARNEALKKHLVKEPKAFGSVYGNMQCMLKGVCAQCLQWQIDPETGERTKAVFACSWQDQPLEIIDIDHIAARVQQNYLHEKINMLWLDYLFDHAAIERV